MEPASTGIAATFGLNAKLFAAQLFNFGIVLFVMWKFVYTPLLKIMDRRAKEIGDGLANAQAADRRLQEASEEKERLLREARAEAHGLLEEARTSAEAVRRDKLRIAMAEIESHVSQAKFQIKSEREAAAASLKREVAELVVAATGKVAASMDEKARKQLASRAVESLQDA